MIKNYDVIIVGAGPAGSSCALALRNTGLDVALIDKCVFPRNKTCGDAIPGPSLKFLKQIFGKSIAEFNDFKCKHRINTSILHLQNGASIQINWKTKAYNCTRSSFDDFLLNLVKKHTHTAIYEGETIKMISKNKKYIKLQTKNTGLEFTCAMLIGSDGANSVVSSLLRDPGRHRSTMALAVSAYYEHVDSPNVSNSFFFLKNVLGYFWIFPVEENVYNVGFGMLKNDPSQKVDIKKHFRETIDQHPVIHEKFIGAKACSGIRGFKLPIAGNTIDLSGERFLLTGDAAHLIDPLGGHGIDKAIHSGMLAARHIERCFQEKNFSSAFNKAYDAVIYEKLLKELHTRFRLLKLLVRFPWLMHVFSFFLKYFKRQTLKFIS